MTTSLSILSLALSGCTKDKPNPESDPFLVYDELEKSHPDQCHTAETNDHYGGAGGEPRYHKGIFSCQSLHVPLSDGRFLEGFTLVDERSYRYEHLHGKGDTGSKYFIRAEYVFDDGTTISQYRATDSSNATGMVDHTFGKSGREISGMILNWDSSSGDKADGPSANAAKTMLAGLYTTLAASP